MWLSGNGGDDGQEGTKAVQGITRTMKADEGADGQVWSSRSASLRRGPGYHKEDVLKE